MCFFFLSFFQFSSFSKLLGSCFFQNRNRQECARGDPRGGVLLLLFTCGALLWVLLFLSSYIGELFPLPLAFIFAPLCLVLNELLFFYHHQLRGFLFSLLKLCFLCAANNLNIHSALFPPPLSSPPTPLAHTLKPGASSLGSLLHWERDLFLKSLSPLSFSVCVCVCVCVSVI